MSVRPLAGPTPSAATSRRSSPRLDAEGILEIHFIQGNALVTLKDLSLGGFAIHTGQPIAVGTVEAFYIGVAGSPGRPISAQATHSRQVEPGVYLSGWKVQGAASSRVIEDAFELLTRQTISFAS